METTIRKEMIDKIQIFIEDRVLNFNDDTDSKLLDGIVITNFKSIMSDDDQLQKLNDYIEENEEEALNELNLLEKMEEILKIKPDEAKIGTSAYFKKLSQIQLENERMDNIFEDNYDEYVDSKEPSLSDKLKQISDEEENEEDDEIVQYGELIKPKIEKKIIDLDELEEYTDEEDDEELDIEVDEINERQKKKGFFQRIKEAFKSEKYEDDFLDAEEEELNIEIDEINERKQSGIKGLFSRLFGKNTKEEVITEEEKPSISDLLKSLGNYDEADEDMEDEIEDLDEDMEDEIDDLDEDMEDEIEVISPSYDIVTTVAKKEPLVEREIVDYIYDNYNEKDIITSIEKSKARLLNIKEQLIDYKLRLYVADENTKSEIMNQILVIEKELKLEQINHDSNELKHQLFMDECVARYEKELQIENEEKEKFEKLQLEKKKQEEAKIKEQYNKDYVEFWSNIEDKELSNFQTYSDEELNELYNEAKENTLLGKAAREMINKANNEYTKDVARKLGISTKLYNEIKEIQKQNLTTKGLNDFIKENKIKGETKELLLKRHN